MHHRGAGAVRAAVEFPARPVAFGGADQLREGEEEAAGRVDVLLELAQDRAELAGVNVIGFQVVFDVLDGEGRSRPTRGRGLDGCNSPHAPQVRELPSGEVGLDRTRMQAALASPSVQFG